MLPAIRAGLDARGDYERDLYATIEQRRAMAREQLERESDPDFPDTRALHYQLALRRQAG
jgi:hypothetical protein